MIYYDLWSGDSQNFYLHIEIIELKLGNPEHLISKSLVELTIVLYKHKLLFWFVVI